MSNLVQIFYDTAAKFPNHTALIHQKTSISYAELASKVQSTASYLDKKGIKKGTRVLVFIPMSIKLYQTVLALFSMGAVVTFVDEWADRQRLTKALKVVPVDAIIAPKKFIWLAYLIQPFSTIKNKISLPSKLTERDFPVKDVLSDDTALITFTTGSTGLPKAANRTHQFLLNQFEILKDEIGAHAGDKCLVTLPIVLLSILGTGATGIIANFNQKKPEKLNAESQAELIKKLGVSHIISSPYYIDKLAECVPFEHDLRQILTGGAPVFPDQSFKIRSAFPKALCRVAYGSTEAEPISVIEMKDIVVNDVGLSVGKIHPKVEVKVIRIVDGPILLGDGGWLEWETDFGEIVVHGPHVLDQYFNSAEAFLLNKIQDGAKVWHRTGDSGRLKGDEIFLNGRCSQLTLQDGQYRSLFILEYQLRQIPGVELATWLDDVIFVEMSSMSKKDEVITAIDDLKLGQKEVKIVNQIPRDPRHFSKIDYGALARMN